MLPVGSIGEANSIINLFQRFYRHNGGQVCEFLNHSLGDVLVKFGSHRSQYTKTGNFRTILFKS